MLDRLTNEQTKMHGHARIVVEGNSSSVAMPQSLDPFIAIRIVCINAYCIPQHMHEVRTEL